MVLCIASNPGPKCPICACHLDNFHCNFLPSDLKCCRGTEQRLAASQGRKLLLDVTAVQCVIPTTKGMLSQVKGNLQNFIYNQQPLLVSNLNKNGTDRQTACCLALTHASTMSPASTCASCRGLESDASTGVSVGWSRGVLDADRWPSSRGTTETMGKPVGPVWNAEKAT
jgi:hypothetical protein